MHRVSDRSSRREKTHVVLITIHQLILQSIRVCVDFLALVSRAEADPDVAVDTEDNVDPLRSTWWRECVEVGFQTTDEGCGDDHELAVT
jgi:hypothetical protein